MSFKSRLIIGSAALILGGSCYVIGARNGLPSNKRLETEQLPLVLINDRNFQIIYDHRLRIPVLVSEILTKDSIKRLDKSIDRGKSKFMSDKSIHEFFQSKISDYKNSGYDRGHMAAAENHCKTQKSMDDTFILSNIAPQVGVGFNRDKWRILEESTRKLTKSYDKVLVFTGPLFLPKKDEMNGKNYIKYELIGDNNVAVPTHFFKVILCSKLNNEGKEIYAMNSYVLPNAPCDDSIPFESFSVPLNSIARHSGLTMTTLRNLADQATTNKLNIDLISTKNNNQILLK
jgi:endonuclease G, mitochondrial